MGEPAPKEKGIADFLDAMFDRTNHIKKNTCTSCGEEAVKFDDEASRKEYTISGMCQYCQNLFYSTG